MFSCVSTSTSCTQRTFKSATVCWDGEENNSDILQSVADVELIRDGKVFMVFEVSNHCITSIVLLSPGNS